MRCPLSRITKRDRENKKEHIRERNKRKRRMTEGIIRLNMNDQKGVKQA